MTGQNTDRTASRKQRLQEKQRRQLAVVDTVDKAEIKVRKAETEMAVAVAEAVQVFGDEQSASEGLDMPVETIRHFLGMAEAEAAGDGSSDKADKMDKTDKAGTVDEPDVVDLPGVPDGADKVAADVQAAARP